MKRNNEQVTCSVCRVANRVPSLSSLSTRCHSLANLSSAQTRVSYPYTCLRGQLGRFWYRAPSDTSFSHPHDPLPPRKRHQDSPVFLSWCALVCTEIIAARHFQHDGTVYRSRFLKNKSQLSVYQLLQADFNVVNAHTIVTLLINIISNWIVDFNYVKIILEISGVH